jgi:DNA gyrase subunit A
MATKDEDVVTELFVTSTHTPVLFFSTLGKVYRMKVWRLPEGGPATRGRPMINLLPLATGETISTVLPLPEDEANGASSTSCSRPPRARCAATRWTRSPTCRTRTARSR